MTVLRKATIKDMGLYFDWVNDTEVRRNALNPDAISMAEHETWFKSNLENSNCVMLIAEISEKPAAQVRFDIEGINAIISYSLEKNSRKKGLGKIVLKKAASYFINENPKITQLEATVLKHNMPSIKTFENLGFSRLLEESDSVIRFHLDVNALEFCS